MELESSLGDDSLKEIVDYLKNNLKRVAETSFSQMLVQELSSLFKLQYYQVDRQVSMDAFLEKDQEKAALCADRAYESFDELDEIMAFSDKATKEAVSSQVRSLLTDWATEDVLRTFTETKLRDVLDDFVSSHLASYTEAVSQPGADCRKSLLLLLLELSKEMAAAIQKFWFEDIQEHQAVSNFQMRMKDIENAIHMKEKKQEPVRYTLDTLPPAPKTEPVVREQPVRQPELQPEPQRVLQPELQSEPQQEPEPVVQPVIEPVPQPVPEPVRQQSSQFVPPPLPQPVPRSPPPPPLLRPGGSRNRQSAPPNTPVGRASWDSLPEPPKNIVFRVPPKSAGKACNGIVVSLLCSYK